MRYKKVLKCTILACLVFVLSVGFAYANPAKIETSKKVFKLKAQTYASPGTIGFKGAELALQHLKEATGGRLDIKLYGGGAIVGLFEMLDALGSGIIDVAINPTTFFAGKDPAFACLMTMVGLWPDSTEAKVWFNHFGGRELAEELLAKYNVKHVGYVMMGVEPIFSKTPIRTLDDLKGKKIRTTSGMGSMLFSKLGASPVNLPGGELYSALDTGVIDAVEWITLSEDVDHGIHEVAKNFLWPSFHCSMANLDFSANMDVWKKLPPDLQAAMKQAAYEIDAYWDYWPRAEDVKTLQKLKKMGLTHTQFSVEEREKARKVSLEVVMEWREKSPMAKRMIDSALNYMRMRGFIE